jgi:LEA14-like dessication related protein
MPRTDLSLRLEEKMAKSQGKDGRYTLRIPIGLTLLLGALILSGCAGMHFRGEPPRLNVADLRVMEATPLEQRYLVKLRIQNPNPDGLTIDGLTFDLFFNGRLLASGMSGEKVYVGRYSDEIMEARATSTAFGIFRQLMALSRGGARSFDYRLKGKLSLAGYEPLPFDRRGSLNPGPAGGGHFRGD